MRKIRKHGQISNDVIMTQQIDELDNLIEECIKKFRDSTTGTDLRILIAEFEELMFLKTKILTQMVIRDQRIKHICKKYQHQSKILMNQPDKNGEKNNTLLERICQNRNADRNSNIALGITVITFLLLILANLDEIVSFVHYVLS